MKGTILEKIINAKRARLVSTKRATDVERLADDARTARTRSQPHRFRQALENPARINLIAEFKRASPSKGVISDSLDPAITAAQYAAGGAAAISVLTEEDFFKGSLDDLIAVRGSVDLPILRKDFIVDEYQIYEAAHAGADAILLIVAALAEDELKTFLRLTEGDLGMDAVVEIHNAAELEIAQRIGSNMIGVNNRDLRTFDVSLDTSRGLIAEKPAGSLMIAESGITSKDEIVELRSLGFDGFLVGETLMRAGDAKQLLEAWI